MNKLDPEEKEILEAFESGEVKRTEGVAESIVEHKKYAEATFKKDA